MYSPYCSTRHFCRLVLSSQCKALGSIRDGASCETTRQVFSNEFKLVADSLLLEPVFQMTFSHIFIPQILPYPISGHFAESLSSQTDDCGTHFCCLPLNHQHLHCGSHCFIEKPLNLTLRPN